MGVARDVLQTGGGRDFDENRRAHKNGQSIFGQAGTRCRSEIIGKRSREEAPDYVERFAEWRAEGRSESEIETIFNNEENEERDQHEAKKQFRASFNHLKKTCPGEDIAGFAIDSEVEQRLEAIQKQKEKEEQEALSKIDASQFGPASPGDFS